MLVFGDLEQPADPIEWTARINEGLDLLEKMAAGFERHSRLSALFIKTGQLLQGFADALFEVEGEDRQTTQIHGLNLFLYDLACALCRSWDTDFEEIGALPRLNIEGELPLTLQLRIPEGYAFYAVYPEAYIDAARRVSLKGAPQVIAIRSIGTSLGAAAAAALGAPPPISVRPFGNPSAREIAIDEALEADVLAGTKHYLIVDEGPGQSGSSFGAVASWLTERGVGEDQITLLPSHGGDPGAAASEKCSRWWRKTERSVGDFEERWPLELERWCTHSIGQIDGPPEDISGGRWRKLHYRNSQDWPAVIPAFERRKFLIRANGEQMLAKFSGLGRIGIEKLKIARLLHSEGFVPEPLGLVHGFLIERWCTKAKPLRNGEKPLCEVARYIGARSRLLATRTGQGASINNLLAMARRNISLEFGNEITRSLESFEECSDVLEQQVFRVRTDNNLSCHEWLKTPSGLLIKTDALDHHQAHDLIGCQDFAWDVAGAIVEFDLDQSSAGKLISAVEYWADRKIARDLLSFSIIAYLAFKLGQSRLGATTIKEDEERCRVTSSGDRYAVKVQHLLESRWAATRPTSLVGWCPERTSSGNKPQRRAVEEEDAASR